MVDRAAARRARRAAKLDPCAGGRARPAMLGVDVGGVIVDLVAEDSDTSFFGSRPLDTPAVLDAVASLSLLRRDVFGGRVVIISKAGPRVSARTREWLAHTGALQQTGIHDGDVHFVRDRRDKAELCRQLGVTHFVDDRADVLEHMSGIVSHRFLFLGGLGRSLPPAVPTGVRVVNSWPQLVPLLRTTAAALQ